MQVTFRDPVRFKHQKELFVASEGMYSGQVRAHGDAMAPHCCIHLSYWQGHEFCAALAAAIIG